MNSELSAWTTHELLLYLTEEFLVLKREVEKFLKPRAFIYIGNERQRRIQVLDSEQVVASLVLEDAAGAPSGGAPDQPPVWAIDDTSLASLTPSADGMSCTIAGKKPGNASISAAFTLGGASMAASGALAILAGAPTQVVLQFGAPSAQPPPAP